MSDSATALEAAEKRYAARVAALGKEGLAADDAWLWGDLGASARASGCLEPADLSRLMRWKLRRGKFRPRLQQMVDAADPDEVREASRRAFRLAAKAKGPSDAQAVRAAVRALSEPLKGVGPATASAALATFRPQVFAFMSDEALARVCSKPFRYSLAEYVKFVGAIGERAAALGDAWTPHRVSQAMWSQAVGRKLGDEEEEEEEDDDDSDDNDKDKDEKKVTPKRKASARAARVAKRART